MGGERAKLGTAKNCGETVRPELMLWHRLQPRAPQGTPGWSTMCPKKGRFRKQNQVGQVGHFRCQRARIRSRTPEMVQQRKEVGVNLADGLLNEDGRPRRVCVVIRNQTAAERHETITLRRGREILSRAKKCLHVYVLSCLEKDTTGLFSSRIKAFRDTTS